MILNNLGVWILAAAPEAADVGIAEQFGLDGAKFAAQIITFVILYILLKKFAFTPISAMLEERSARIAESLANAEKVKAELERAEQERKAILAKANESANALIEEAKKAAADLTEKKNQEAVLQAEAIIKKAQEAMALEREKLLSEVKREVARLVVATTTKVTGKILTPEDQNRLNQEAVKELAA
jgi:F-type H+-transporting ATPase subunit b